MKNIDSKLNFYINVASKKKRCIVMSNTLVLDICLCIVVKIRIHLKWIDYIKEFTKNPVPPKTTFFDAILGNNFRVLKNLGSVCYLIHRPSSRLDTAGKYHHMNAKLLWRCQSFQWLPHISSRGSHGDEGYSQKMRSKIVQSVPLQTNCKTQSNYI
jgi:hypothetical protein